MATGSKDLDVEAETDQLYELPLDAFVGARNSLAARLKASGDKDGAARVKALARPNIPAWAANQVYWSARAAFDALLASVERLRHAQQSGAGGEALREAMKARREAQDIVLRTASARLASAGHGTNPETLHRVSKTLEALAAQAARPGRLVQDLEPPGFDAFAASGVAELPRPGPRMEPAASARIAPGATTAPKADLDGTQAVAAVEAIEDPAATVTQRAEERRATALVELRALLVESEQRLDLARRHAKEAAGAHSVAETRAEAAGAELEEATRRFERAQERAALTAEDEVAARRKAEQLAAARDVAEADRDDALRALKAAGTLR